MKRCSCCGEEKSLDQFHKRSSRPSGRASHCKECRKKKENSRYIANRERIIRKQRKYNEKNRDVINAKRRIYVAKNKEKVKAYYLENRDSINDYMRRRRQIPEVRLAENIRRRINYALSVGRFDKKGKTQDILGCTWEELVSHLESQFEEGMTWENMGKWEIDHIIPYASAKSEEEVIRLSHYTNIRPLWRKENRQKGGKY